MPKYLNNPNNISIYKCAQQIWQQCFLEDNSLLFTNTLWTLQNLNDLHSAFVLNPDETKGKNFFVKLEGQIGSSSQQIIRLTAELLCLYYLFTNSVSKEKKTENVNNILAWSKDSIPSNNIILEAFNSGIGGTGEAYNIYMPFELGWIIDILIAFKKYSADERKFLSEPLKFVEFIDNVPMKGNRQSRHTLLHLLFPDIFERIAKKGDKEKIVKFYREFISNSSTNIDEQLFQIRKNLENKYPNEQLDFYNPPLNEQWNQENYNSDETLENEFMTWFAKQKKTDGKPYKPSAMKQYRNALKRAVKKLEGVKIVPTNLFYYKTLTEFIDVCDKIVAAPNYAEVNSNFASGSLKSGMDRYKEFLTARAMDSTDEKIIEIKPQRYDVQYVFTDSDIQTYFAGCFLNPEILRQMLIRLSSKKNLILQGPPGTGKTWLAKRLAQAITRDKGSDRIKTMQFHATLSYEDFIRGWRPTGQGGLDLIDGPFLESIEDAEKDLNTPHVMVIEEINRGNPAQIFGEMLTLLESDKRYPTEAIRLCYQKVGKRCTVYVPKNLYIIGTMNIADRSLAIVDFALRRRFAFFDLEPAFDSHQWKHWMNEKANISMNFLDKIAEGMKECNQKISNEIALGPQYAIGHSYFTTDEPVSNAVEWFTDIVDTEIMPLLCEYWFDSRKTAKDTADMLKSRVLA